MPRAERVRFEELAEDLLTDYRINEKRSIEQAEYSIKQLGNVFKEWQAVDITTAEVKRYIEGRKRERATIATINRELVALKRMFNFALRAEKLLSKPYIPQLDEDNVRTGFFEAQMFLRVWGSASRTHQARSDVWLSHRLAQAGDPEIDVAASGLWAWTIRLEPGTPKNREGE